MRNEESDKFVDEIEAALNEVFTRNNKLLTKFVLVVENISGEDAERSIWVTRGEDTYPWDAAGLLAFVDQLEQAHRTTHDFLDHGIDPHGDGHHG